LQLRSALDKLEECRHNLNSCLEENARLNRYGSVLPLKFFLLYDSTLKLSILGVEC
jgi:hypothetical protein